MAESFAQYWISALDTLQAEISINTMSELYVQMIQLHQHNNLKLHSVKLFITKL